MKFRVQVHNSLDRLGPNWRSFERRAIASPFQNFNWVSSWMSHFCRGAELTPFIVFAYDETDTLRVIFPLAVQDTRSCRKLIWIGDRQSAYNCPLVDRKALLNASDEAISGLWQDVIDLAEDLDLVHFVRQPEQIDGKKNPFLLKSSISRLASDRMIPLADSWTDFADRVGREALEHQSVEATRRLKRRGRLKISLNVRLPDEPDLLRHFFDLSQTHDGPDTKATLGGFYRSLAESSENSPLRLTTVTVDDALIAGAIGFPYADRYFVTITAIEQGADGAAGEYLLGEELVRSCIVQGLSGIEFLGNTCPDTSWATPSNNTFDTFFGLTAKGLAASTFIRTSTEILKPFFKRNERDRGSRRLFPRTVTKPKIPEISTTGAS